jgi:hypothetical protein
MATKRNILLIGSVGALALLAYGVLGYLFSVPFAEATAEIGAFGILASGAAFFAALWQRFVKHERGFTKVTVGMALLCVLWTILAVYTVFTRSP